MQGQGLPFDRILSAALLISALALTGWGFLPELLGTPQQMNDVAFHISIIKALDQARSQAGSIFDFWYDLSPLGYPLFRNYQHIPHLSIYALYLVTFGYFSIDTIVNFSTCLLALAFPLSIAWSARSLGLPTLAAAAAGLFAALSSESGDYGLGLHNYTWGSGGIITQLWAMTFLPPALALSLRYVQSSRSLALALLAIFLTFGSHLVAGLILAVSCALYLAVQLLAGQLSKAGLRRWLLLGIGAALVISHQWVLTLIDRDHINSSPHESAWKFSSHGIAWVLNNFWNGDLLDFGRFPGTTALALLGFFFCLLWRQNSIPLVNRIWLAASLPVWLLFLCGWEVLGDLSGTPLLRTMHLHRLIVAVQFFGALLAGYGAYMLTTRLRLPGAFLLALLLAPLFTERIERYRLAHIWKMEANQAISADSDLKQLISHLKASERGWIYPGMYNTWTDEFKIGKHLKLHNVLIQEGLPTLSILYHSLGLAGDVTFDLSLQREEHLAALAVRWIVAPSGWQPPDFLKEDHRFGRYILYQYPKALALGVGNLSFEAIDRSPTLTGAMRAWFRSSLVERAHYGVLSPVATKDLPKLALSTSDLENTLQHNIDLPGRVWVENLSTSQTAAGKVYLNRPALVILKTNYHPNWRAWINEAPADVLRVTPGFAAIECPSGEHGVTFRYEGSQAKGILFVIGLLFPLLVISANRILRQPDEN